MVCPIARSVSLSSGLSLVLACGFDSGGVADSTSESGDDSGGSASNATLDPSVTASATSTMGGSASATATTDGADDGSGTTEVGSSGTDPGTTGTTETSNGDTTGDATTTDDPSQGSSSDSGATDPVYGPCAGVEDCNPGAQCYAFNGAGGPGDVIGTVCYEPCDMVACPEPRGGGAEPVCVPDLMACGLDCSSGPCPDGMDCFNLTNIGPRCAWPT